MITSVYMQEQGTSRSPNVDCIQKKSTFPEPYVSVYKFSTVRKFLKRMIINSSKSPLKARNRQPDGIGISTKCGNSSLGESVESAV